MATSFDFGITVGLDGSPFPQLVGSRMKITANEEAHTYIVPALENDNSST